MGKHAQLFKVGDKVRIKEYISVGDEFDGCTFVSSMQRYKQEILTIAEVYDDENRYRIKEHGFAWVDEFFELADCAFVDKNAVKLRNGEIRVVLGDRLYLLDGTSIGVENYTGRKHNFDDSFDIIEVRKPNSNFLFDFNGEIVEE